MKSFLLLGRIDVEIWEDSQDSELVLKKRNEAFKQLRDKFQSKMNLSLITLKEEVPEWASRTKKLAKRMEAAPVLKLQIAKLGEDSQKLKALWHDILSEIETKGLGRVLDDDFSVEALEQ